MLSHSSCTLTSASRLLAGKDAPAGTVTSASRVLTRSTRPWRLSDCRRRKPRNREATSMRPLATVPPRMLPPIVTFSAKRSSFRGRSSTCGNSARSVRTSTFARTYCSSCALPSRGGWSTTCVATSAASAAIRTRLRWRRVVNAVGQARGAATHGRAKPSPTGSRDCTAGNHEAWHSTRTRRAGSTNGPRHADNATAMLVTPVQRKAVA